MECGARGRAANRALVTDSVVQSLQVSLSSAYKIGRELGGGGMSRVFLAEETRFGRNVVIKVLPPDVSGAISAERFEREIQLVARLQQSGGRSVLDQLDVARLSEILASKATPEE